MGFLFLLLGAAGMAAFADLDLDGSDNDVDTSEETQEDDVDVSAEALIDLLGDATVVDGDDDGYDVETAGGDDVVIVDGNQVLDGEDFTDADIETNDGDDYVELSGGHGSHADEIDLGAGDDVINVGFGSVVDSLIMGAGADVLAMTGMCTEVTVEDFDPAEDVLALDLGLSFLNGDDAMDYVEFDETDDGVTMAVVEPEGTEIFALVTLKGLTMNDVANLEIMFG